MTRREGDDFENSEAFIEVQGALARKIKRLREQHGLSQRQLASIADVSGPHFGLIEAGVGNVSLLVLVKIAKALGVPVSDLFEGIGSSKAPWTARIVRLAANLEKAVRAPPTPHGRDCPLCRRFRGLHASVCGAQGAGRAAPGRRRTRPGCRSEEGKTAESATPPQKADRGRGGARPATRRKIA